MPKGNYLSNKTLNEVLGAAAFAAPVTHYVRLYTAAPTSAGGGTEVATSDWSNYAPVSLTNNTTNWPTTTTQVKANGVAVDFGTAVIPGANVTVVAFAIWDAASAGNLLYWGTLGASKIIQNGSPASFPAGLLTVTET